MKWSAQNPDLNPDENVRGLMQSSLHNRSVPPRNHMHMFRTRSQIWNSLPDSYFSTLFASMPRRVKMLRKQRGRSYKYLRNRIHFFL